MPLDDHCLNVKVLFVPFKLGDFGVAPSLASEVSVASIQLVLSKWSQPHFSWLGQISKFTPLDGFRVGVVCTFL